MVKTGILRIDDNTGVSQLDSGPGDRKRLVKSGAGDPFGNATNFLVDERNLNDGDFIFVTGEEGSHAGVSVIAITDAGLATEAVGVLSAPKKKKKKKSGKKSNKESSK